MVYIIFKNIKNGTKREKQINTIDLVNNGEKRKEYQNLVQEKLGTEMKDWEEIKEIVTSAATEVVGLEEKNRRTTKHDAQIADLSQKQKEIKVKLSNTKEADKITELRKERNRLLKAIKKRQREVDEAEIDKICEEINSANNDQRFFKAVKQIRTTKNKKNSIIFNKDGSSVINNNKKYLIVKNHFKDHFNNPQAEDIEPFKGEPRPLDKKISKEEIIKATNKMNKNKATGKDGIKVELLKYGPDELHENLKNNFNKVFETHNDQFELQQSVLLPTPKPNKQAGPVKNLRPINILNSSRKIFSTVALNRITPKVEEYLSQSQAAYRRKRSTTDIVWAHRFIAAKAQLYRNLEVKITGIDMSSAFDTIDRKSLLDEMSTFLDNDEMRMCQLLLANNDVYLRFDNHLEEYFTTNKGAPQGDAISGTFFTIALEKALRDIRSIINESDQGIEHSYSIKSSLPNELIYADDTDFVNTDINKDKIINQHTKQILAKHGLLVNDDKTEHTMVKRETSKVTESWREVKKLGSLLGDHEDLKRRIQLSKAAMSTLHKVWLKKKVNISKKLKIYKAIVKPILTYNMSTWGLTKAETREVDAAHRKHLREIWNNPWKKNKDVYKDSGEIPLHVEMKSMRWRALGHMLRLPMQAPCQLAMQFYFERPVNAKKFSGRKRSTLPIKLDEDITTQTAKNKILPGNIMGFKTMQDLIILRNIAQDRDLWKKLSEVIVDVQGEEYTYNSKPLKVQ